MFGLTNVYLAFVIFEIVMINGLGFISLMFQNVLQRLSARFITQNRIQQTWKADPLFLRFWTTVDATCREIQFFHYLIAGWLAIAGILQALIHFYNDSPPGLKRACLFTFFGCDIFWIVLMITHRDLFKWTHVYGSIVTISLRIPFVIAPRLMFT